ncbi:MAG TPA: alpha/beta hydrolase [Pseudacidobacterium sp.]|jgi:pimeloyl-ACP methyl ester carboxylesterase|nr:alpha/beta hydrolase [Pseudacidobacterium sp.]
MALASWMLLAEGPQPGEQDIQVDGHRMHCLVMGNGPSLLLLHGLLGSAEAWLPCLSWLGNESSVYAVDTLGIGHSERVPGLNAGLAAQADRMAQFMENAGIERADIAGTSHGGAIAMMLAARHPQLVRSLVLHAPANPFSNLADPLLHFYRSPLGQWFAQFIPNLPERLQELALGRMYGNSQLVRNEVREMYMRSLRVPGTVDHVLDILNRWFDDMRTLELALDAIRDVPTLLVWGTRDRAVSLASGRLLGKMLDHAEMAVLQGVGHLPYEEAPDTFAEAINAFLYRQERGDMRKGLQLVRS